jgi:hypothetical protein
MGIVYRKEGKEKREERREKNEGWEELTIVPKCTIIYINRYVLGVKYD